MNLKIENVSSDMYERLCNFARARNRDVSEVVLDAVERELARYEWLDRHACHPGVDLGVAAASLLEDERECRNT